MIQLLSNELLWIVLSNLEYQDLDNLLQIKTIAPAVLHYIQKHYEFHYKVSSILRLFETIPPSARQTKETKLEFTNQLLQLICKNVELLDKTMHPTKFSQLLEVVQQLILDRILAEDLKVGLEHDYANLCLEIRSTYLHTPSIRVMHDPKYRRRSTKHPLAPFLPRDYTFVWRRHCNQSINRKIRIQFALFFGSLFDVTSLYLESNLDGSFEECTREALVTRNVEDLLMMYVAAHRPVDVEGMCMMVTHAGEQLRHYLDSMDHWITTDPTPQQELRMQQHDSPALFEGSEEVQSPPEWLIPDRYKVEADTILRLKLMHHLYQKGWHWFQ